MPYAAYLTIHHRSMRRLDDEGILLSNGLSIGAERGDRLEEVALIGLLRCRRDVAIRVYEILAVRYERGRPYVKGTDYTYHAWFGATGRSIIRYDNTHDPADLHCHLFDPATQEETILSVPWDALPMLEGFIRIADGIARNA